MIKIENIDILGWEAAIRGMRNPMNSWSKSDSKFVDVFEDYNEFTNYYWNDIELGENDHKLAMSLCKAGTDHRKFLRMITVYVDITAPFYWWKEFDTYKVGTVANSCSTMHKIADKEFTLDDFSSEHLTDSRDYGTELLNVNGEGTDIFVSPYNLLKIEIGVLNNMRKMFIETKDKKWWWQMIQLLPTSYNQKRTVMLNYEVLANMYHSRKNHKLDEWRRFCEFIEELPYSELITD